MFCLWLHLTSNNFLSERERENKCAKYWSIFEVSFFFFFNIFVFIVIFFLIYLLVVERFMEEKEEVCLLLKPTEVKKKRLEQENKSQISNNNKKAQESIKHIQLNLYIYINFFSLFILKIFFFLLQAFLYFLCYCYCLECVKNVTIIIFLRQKKNWNIFMH